MIKFIYFCFCPLIRVSVNRKIAERYFDKRYWGNEYLQMT